MNMTDYTSQFSSLNTARITGKNAPHKAVLLLTIMDLVQAGVINSTRIDFDGGTLWKRSGGNRKKRVRCAGIIFESVK